jgi:hypothetical protein
MLLITLPTTTAEIEDPDPTQVEEAIKALSGDGEIWLGDPTRIGLGFAGGPERYFVAFASHVEGVQLQALASDPPSDDGVALVGGQVSTLPAACLVSVAEAISAAMYLLSAEGPDPEIEWERL